MSWEKKGLKIVDKIEPPTKGVPLFLAKAITSIISPRAAWKINSHYNKCKRRLTKAGELH